MFKNKKFNLTIVFSLFLFFLSTDSWSLECVRKTQAHDGFVSQAYFEKSFPKTKIFFPDQFKPVGGSSKSIIAVEKKTFKDGGIINYNWRLLPSGKMVAFIKHRKQSTKKMPGNVHYNCNMKPEVVLAARNDMKNTPNTIKFSSSPTFGNNRSGKYYLDQMSEEVFFTGKSKHLTKVMSKAATQKKLQLFIDSFEPADNPCGKKSLTISEDKYIKIPIKLGVLDGARGLIFPAPYLKAAVRKRAEVLVTYAKSGKSWVCFYLEKNHNSHRDDFQKMLVKFGLGTPKTSKMLSDTKALTKVKKSELAKAKSECSTLGFTAGTEKHGDCVMKLMDIIQTTSGNKCASYIENSTPEDVRALADALLKGGVSAYQQNRVLYIDQQVVGIELSDGEVVGCDPR